MKWARALGYGVVLWLVPFALAIAIFPVRENNRALFESIMPVALVFLTVILALHYFRTSGNATLKNGVIPKRVILDPFDGDKSVHSAKRGQPIGMELGEYMSDIGLTYALIPAITIGIVLARGTGNLPDQSSR